ncbi:hypothetical protein GGH96_002994 [Coemansia sp. RSA 1972]|nr:hypothetical protein GGH96_002994 [Coemansia sp. RSA 1972]
MSNLNLFGNDDCNDGMIYSDGYDDEGDYMTDSDSSETINPEPLGQCATPNSTRNNSFTHGFVSFLHQLAHDLPKGAIKHLPDPRPIKDDALDYSLIYRCPNKMPVNDLLIAVVTTHEPPEDQPVAHFIRTIKL